MKIRICYHNSIGLKNDALILKEAIERNEKDGVSVILLEYKERELYAHGSRTFEGTHEYDLQFFMEHIHCEYHKQAKINVFVPNIEFMNTLDVQWISHMQFVWAKTKTSFKILQSKYPNKTIVHTEWTSIDRFLPTEKTYTSLLHVRGCSRFKNTEMVLATWLRHPEWPPITIVQHSANMNGNVDIPLSSVALTSNITLIQRKVSEEELNQLMNTHNIHVCPSMQEGFGHYINEARSCQAVVCTTHGYPMCEMVSQHECLIVTTNASKQSLGISYGISHYDFEQCMLRIISNIPSPNQIEIGRQARTDYLSQKSRFHENVKCFIISLKD